MRLADIQPFAPRWHYICYNKLEINTQERTNRRTQSSKPHKGTLKYLSRISLPQKVALSANFTTKGVSLLCTVAIDSNIKKTSVPVAAEAGWRRIKRNTSFDVPLLTRSTTPFLNRNLHTIKKKKVIKTNCYLRSNVTCYVTLLSEFRFGPFRCFFFFFTTLAWPV